MRMGQPARPISPAKQDPDPDRGFSCNLAFSSGIDIMPITVVDRNDTVDEDLIPSPGDPIPSPFEVV